MGTTYNLMLALEKIKRPEDQSHLVYTYVLTPDGSNPVAYFIPLLVCSSYERAKEKVEEIIATTGYQEILIYPINDIKTCFI